MKRSTILRTAAVGATCAVVGAAAGIAGTSADPPSPGARADMPLHRWLKFGPLGAGPGLMMALPGVAAGPPVHSDAIVPNEKGGFDTITMDRGKFASLSGQDLTITEGTKTATYKTVTLTIPSDATVRRNGEDAHLSDIKSGDTVNVVQSPKGTFVDAFDAQHEAVMRIKVPGPGGPLAGKDGEVPPPGQLKPAPSPPDPGQGEGAGFSTSEGPESSSSSS
jgi:hypothetical protein